MEKKSLFLRESIKQLRWVVSFSVLFLFSILSPDSRAALRTVQFVGSIITHTQRIRIDQFQEHYTCSVVLVNTGTTDQYVNSIVFQNLSAASSQVTGTANPDQDSIYNTASGSACVGDSTTPCWTSTNLIKPNGIYVGIKFIDPVALAGSAIGLCSGTIQVRDANDSAPGSVVASGSISFIAEQAITGGQFNGALYLSGSPLDAGGVIASDEVWANTSVTAASTFDVTNFRGAMQMNLYCNNACRVARGAASSDDPIADPFCNAACGMNSSVDSSVNFDGSGFNNHFSYLNMAGWFQNQASGSLMGYKRLNSSAPDNFSVGATPVTGSAVFTGNDSDSTSPNYDHNNAISATSAAPLGADFRAMFRYANPHYAGGYVQELIVGPFNSICSGNPGYYSTDVGGTDFSHIDTIDLDQGLILASPQDAAKASYPPERLFCSHTHLQDTPFGYVSPATQFAINGGDAF